MLSDAACAYPRSPSATISNASSRPVSAGHCLIGSTRPNSNDGSSRLPRMPTSALSRIGSRCTVNSNDPRPSRCTCCGSSISPSTPRDSSTPGSVTTTAPGARSSTWSCDRPTAPAIRESTMPGRRCPWSIPLRASCARPRSSSPCSVRRTTPTVRPPGRSRYRTGLPPMGGPSSSSAGLLNSSSPIISRALWTGLTATNPTSTPPMLHHR